MTSRNRVTKYQDIWLANQRGAHRRGVGFSITLPPRVCSVHMSSNGNKRQQSRARAYCFTINNWNDTDADQLQQLCNSDKVKYFIGGKETGEEGTPHIQGYVMFKTPTAFSTVKGFLSRAHIEVARGTPEENIAYCSKDGNYIEHGDRPMTQEKKGERGREYWETQLKLARENKLEDVDPKLQLSHWKNLVAIRDYYLKDLGNEYRPDCKNYWLYGPTGTGTIVTGKQL